jgi:hypothetical protein
VIVDHADLVAVFYGADFAQLFARRRNGVDDVELRAILGTADDQALEGRAMAASRIARFPAGLDVRVDDRLVALEDWPGVPTGTTFRLLDNPQRVVDGLEVEAVLGSASTS